MFACDDFTEILHQVIPSIVTHCVDWQYMACLSFYLAILRRYKHPVQ